MNEHSKNFYKVKKYHDGGLWTEKMVCDAAKNPPDNPWITEEEAEEIINGKD